MLSCTCVIDWLINGDWLTEVLFVTFKFIILFLSVHFTTHNATPLIHLNSTNLYLSIILIAKRHGKFVSLTCGSNSCITVGKQVGQLIGIFIRSLVVVDTLDILLFVSIGNLGNLSLVLIILVCDCLLCLLSLLLCLCRSLDIFKHCVNAVKVAEDSCEVGRYRACCV